MAKIIRNKSEIATVEVSNIKKGSSDAKVVYEGEMCGLNLKTKQKLEIQEGD
jgi:translation elongation factor EF-1alpha